MSIRPLMSRNLITLDMDDTLQKAKETFDKHNIHHILVVDGYELVGVITDRDIYKHLSPAIGTIKETHNDIAMMKKRLHLIMSRKLVTATENLSLNEAVLRFHENHISCLPVVDANYIPIGIITWRDILKVVALQYKQKTEG